MNKNKKKSNKNNKKKKMFSSVQLKVVSMRSGKQIYASRRLRRFPNVVFKTVPMLV